MKKKERGRREALALTFLISHFSFLSNKQYFTFQIKTELFFYAGFDFLHERFYVGGGGFTGIDDYVAVPGGYLGAA